MYNGLPSSCVVECQLHPSLTLSVKVRDQVSQLTTPVCDRCKCRCIYRWCDQQKCKWNTQYTDSEV